MAIAAIFNVTHLSNGKSEQENLPYYDIDDLKNERYHVLVVTHDDE